MEEEITQQAWSTDQYPNLKTTTLSAGTTLDPAQSQSHSADLFLSLHTFAKAAVL